jgi:predicted small integral membrane protein
MEGEAGPFAWMAWTPVVAVFFAAIGLMLVGMAVWEVRSPSVARKGVLPMATTRGDRLFVGLLAAAYINLAWTGLTDLSQWVGGALGLGALLLIMRWG